MAIQKLYLHPNDIEEFRTHCPFSFTKSASSNIPTKADIVCGGVYKRDDTTFYPLYWTFGYGEETNDFLEKVDNSINRIACYLANIDTEEVDGIVKPYIQYDDENQMAIGRFGVTIANGNDINSSNLQQIQIEGSYKQFAYSEAQDNLADAIWSTPRTVTPASVSYSPMPTIDYDVNNKVLSSLVIDASIPIFVDEESAREYIATGNVLAGKCFNLDEMMLSEPTQHMISTRTYEYDSDKNNIAVDDDIHVLYLRTFEGQRVSAYVADDGSKYNIRINLTQGSSNIDTVQYRVGAGSFQTVTIDEFNNSQYAKDFNTWKDFEQGRDC